MPTYERTVCFWFIAIATVLSTLFGLGSVKTLLLDGGWRLIVCYVNTLYYLGYVIFFGYLLYDKEYLLKGDIKKKMYPILSVSAMAVVGFILSLVIPGQPASLGTLFLAVGPVVTFCLFVFIPSFFKTYKVVEPTLPTYAAPVQMN